MSAAFALDFSGPPAREIPPAPPERHFDRHCVVCGRAFTVFGANGQEVFSTCGQPECVLHFARHGDMSVALRCRCPQREFPHELSVHFELRSEAFHPKLRQRWPWSLMLSSRLEPSAERKQA